MIFKSPTTLLLLTLILAFSSCTPLQNSTSNSAANYYKQQPDLSAVKYEGGDGKTAQTAIIIRHAKNERNGVAAEYAYLTAKFGQKFSTWRPTGQATLSANGKQMDRISIETIPGKEEFIFYFDISEFFGKL